MPLALSALLIFMVVMTVRFQPWDFDDNKLLVYFQLFALAVVFAVGVEFFKNLKKLFITMVVLFSVAFSFSGIIDVIPHVYKSIDDHPIIFDSNARSLADFIREKISPFSLILTSEDFLNPVDSLSGRPVYLGYPGWLWSHGISYGARDEKLRTFYKNPISDTEIQKEFPFSYIMVDDEAVRDWGAERAVFAEHYKQIFQAGQFTLYQK